MKFVKCLLLVFFKFELGCCCCLSCVCFNSIKLTQLSWFFLLFLVFTHTYSHTLYPYGRVIYLENLKFIREYLLCILFFHMIFLMLIFWLINCKINVYGYNNVAIIIVKVIQIIDKLYILT